MSSNWYESTCRRIFLDVHIPDWHEEFMSQFDPDEFADCVVLANAATATMMANTHTGLCNYPTQVGAMHRNLKGQDVFGTVLDRCHARGINVVMYYCTIYVDWYWEHHPEARVVDAEGRSQKVVMGKPGRPRRFSLCCPNNAGYRDFVVAQLAEICDGYDFEGVWPDMAFWPTVCYCPSCQERYRREVGGEIPRVIDWTDPIWVTFQKKRQEWQLDFARLVTSTIKSKKPGVTVAHQSLTFCGDWLFGPSVAMTQATDWLSADLYGERYGISFYAKLFHSQSENKPFEHLNSWCYPNIHEHVIAKTEDQLRAMTFSAFANHGAMVFIDAIDPVGRVHRKSYEAIGRVFGDLARYEPYAGGKFCQDVGIFFSFDANFDLAESGRDAMSAGYNFEAGGRSSSPWAHRNAARNMAKTLIQHHIPFGALSKKNLATISDYQVIVLPNVAMLDELEMDALREYVSNGGNLYASKSTSLISREGVLQPDFLLSDLFGVSYVGETGKHATYVTPQDSWSDLFGDFSTNYPITLNDSQLQVNVTGEAEVLATVTLPYTDPASTRYASILTDPPGIGTEYPALVLNQYGQGKVLYASGVLETWQHDSQRSVLANLLRLLSSRPFYHGTDAPKSVEMTLFDQPDRQRCILHVLNYQQELPNIPIYDLPCRVWLAGRSLRRLVLLPDETPLEYRVTGDHAEFTVPKVQDYVALALEYE